MLDELFTERLGMNKYAARLLVLSFLMNFRKGEPSAGTCGRLCRYCTERCIRPPRHGLECQCHNHVMGPETR